MMRTFSSRLSLFLCFLLLTIPSFGWRFESFESLRALAKEDAEWEDLLAKIPRHGWEKFHDAIRTAEQSDWARVQGNPWLDRVKNAAAEAIKYGFHSFWEWMGSPGHQQFYNNFTYVPVFTSDDLKGTNVSCFRIPSVTQTANGTIVAFAEARGHFGIEGKGSCADCSALGIAVKRSFDGGQTWVPKVGFTWALDPYFSVGKHPAGASKVAYRNSGGNPVAVYDRVHDRILLHFVRGQGNPDGDCVPGDSNWQVVSSDHGATWSAPQNISKYLGDFVGSLPGPGRGGVQAPSGRLLFNAHRGTAERGSGAVAVYYSDDFGETYKIAKSPFPHMDESTMTAAPNGDIIINMRNDPATSGCKSPSLSSSSGKVSPVPCHVRAVARSSDGGATWTTLSFDETLPDPICEASLSTVGNTTVFFNPTMQFMRSMPALRFSYDNGKTWAKTEPVGDSFVDYSAIVNGALVAGPEADKGKLMGGVLWTGCKHPVTFRLWCTPIDQIKGLGTWWNIGFTRFEVPSQI